MKRIGLVVLTAAGLAAGAGDAAAQAAGNDSTTAGGSLTIPLPVLFYTPETRLGGGVALLHSRRASDDAAQRPSGFSVQALYTAEGQSMLSAGTDLYTRANRYHFTGGVNYSEYPTSFWGIGEGTTDGMKEHYTSRTAGLGLELERQVAPGLYVGAGTTASRVRIVETEEDGLLAGGGLVGSEGGWTVGAGVSAMRDTRDNLYTPHGGSYVRATADAFGGDHRFSRYRLDLRRYAQVGPGVVAAQGVGTFTRGSVPFYLLPVIGGQNQMRGYEEGRYRDRHAVSAQMEYRLPVWRRLGVAAFVGAGAVAADLHGFGSSDAMLSGGWGVRYLLSRSEGLNIRVDFGQGEGSGGTYITLGEAF